MSRHVNVLAAVGIYIGLLGLIVAAASPDSSRQYGGPLFVALLAWVIGLVFLIGAYIEARRPE